MDINKLVKELKKEFGADSGVSTLTDGVEQLGIPYYIPSSSTLLNAIIGAEGFPGGRVVEIIGKSSTGKSVICYDVVAQVQRQGGIGMYIDTETSLDTTFASVFGVDPDKLLVSRAFTVEEVYDQARAFITKVRSSYSPDCPLVIIGDSMTPAGAEEQNKHMDEPSKIGENARLQRRGLRNMINFLSANNAMFLGINHVTTNIGAKPWEPKEVSTGGSGWSFYPHLRLKLSSPQKIEGSTKGSVIGLKVKATVIKNKLNVPFKSCDLFIDFKNGIDDVQSVVGYLRENTGVFGTSKGWYDINGTKMRQGQVIEQCHADPEFFNTLKKLAVDAMSDVVPEEDDVIKSLHEIDVPIDTSDDALVEF